MKRVGRPLRECDAKYLSGQPSFTSSSWGVKLKAVASLTLRSKGTKQDAPDEDESDELAELPSTPANPTRRNPPPPEFHGADAAFADAKVVYVSSSLPLLSHLWPSITKPPHKTVRVRGPIRSTMRASQSEPVMSKNRRLSLDPYAAAGSQFRADTTGKQLANYTHGLNADDLHPADKRNLTASIEKKKEARRSFESKRKVAWNSAPQVEIRIDPKLSDPSPFKTITYEQYYQQKKKMRSKTVNAAYRSKPFAMQSLPNVYEPPKKKATRV